MHTEYNVVNPKREEHHYVDKKTNKLSKKRERERYLK